MTSDVSLVHRVVHGAKIFVHRAGFDVTRETFKRRFVRSLQAHGVDTALDIGANTGQFGAALRRAGFGGRIVSLEPLQSAYDELSRQAAADPGWTVQRSAVGSTVGTLTMNIAANSVSSSPLPILERHTDAAPGSTYVGTEEVAATTVDDLVAGHAITPETALLKIDVQGYEQAVLDGAQATLPRFAAVRTEMSLVPLYGGQVLMPEIISHLGARGFALWMFEPGFVEPATGRLLQADGVFFREEA